MGKRPQAVLNEQFVDSCDFGVALFWSRLGSPTGAAASGSVEEIDRLLANGGKVMVYFCTAPVPQDQIADEQFKKLQHARNVYQQQGLVAMYADVTELRQAFQLHLSSLVNALLRRDRTPGLPTGLAEPATLPWPEVRVKVRVGGVGLLCVEVQNHSPRDLHMLNLWFEFADFRRMCIATADWSPEKEREWPRRIEAGDAAWFWFKWADVKRYAAESSVKSADIVSVVVIDKIDRQFRSPSGELQGAVQQLKDVRTVKKRPRA
jgi:hypothetical protein